MAPGPPNFGSQYYCFRSTPRERAGTKPLVSKASRHREVTWSKRHSLGGVAAAGPASRRPRHGQAGRGPGARWQLLRVRPGYRRDRGAAVAEFGQGTGRARAGHLAHLATRCHAYLVTSRLRRPAPPSSVSRPRPSLRVFRPDFPRSPPPNALPRTATMRAAAGGQPVRADTNGQYCIQCCNLPISSAADTVTAAGDLAIPDTAGAMADTAIPDTASAMADTAIADILLQAISQSPILQLPISQ